VRCKQGEKSEKADQETAVAQHRMVRVTRDNGGFDDFGLPRVSRARPRVELTAGWRVTHAFHDWKELQDFLDACRAAGEDAFGPPPSLINNGTAEVAWERFRRQLRIA
jgi:hypothetical protein